MSSRNALAVSLYVEGQRCVVVGDGPMADERAARLHAAHADVRRVPGASYTPDTLDGARLVVVVDTSRDLPTQVATDARSRGVLVYVLDQPGLSDFAMPALARRGPLTLAISTEGTAPALARRMREELEALLATGGSALDQLVDELARSRAAMPPGERKDALYELARRLRIDGRIVID